MDYDIEWLFEEVFKFQKAYPNESLNFISDWNAHGNEMNEFNLLLAEVYNRSSYNSKDYNYAFNQFDIKEQILELLASTSDGINDDQLAITPSATTSIYLIMHGLAAMNCKRILLITPAYFATHSSLDRAGCSVYYYHLTDNESLKIDFERFETIVQEQFINGIILTDPVYSSGVEFNLDDYKALAKICIKYNIYFIVDYSLGGLEWDVQTDFILNYNKIEILKTCKRFAFVDTLVKRLLLNGIKFSLIFGDSHIIDIVDRMAESTYGALNSVQCYLIKELYKRENSKMITKLSSINITNIKNQFNLVKSLLIGSDFNIINTNSGYFSMINHNQMLLNEMDSKKFSLTLLRENKIICMTKDRFTYFPQNKFGFRINLLNKLEQLTFGIRQSIGIDCGRFNKRN